jgi:hypothetical protein
VFKIGRDCERFERFIGKLLGKKSGETVAELLARKFAGAAFKFPANKFEPVGFHAAEALDGQRQPLLGVIGDGQNAAREVELLRPQMKQRFFAVTAHFPGHPCKRGGGSAALADFDNPRGSEFPEAGP